MTDDPIRDAIQRHLLDAAGDGWSVTQFVISMGLEKLASDGTVESVAWYWAPPNQPLWQTTGLLDQIQGDIHREDPDDDD